MNEPEKSVEWYEIKPYEHTSQMIDYFDSGSDDFSRALMSLLSMFAFPFILLIAAAETAFLPIWFVGWIGRKLGILKVKKKK